MKRESGESPERIRHCKGSLYNYPLRRYCFGKGVPTENQARRTAYILSQLILRNFKRAVHRIKRIFILNFLYCIKRISVGIRYSFQIRQSRLYLHITEFLSGYLLIRLVYAV